MTSPSPQPAHSNIDTIILRFRDLVTEEGLTIQLHRQICHSSGFVWWGWWSKGHETIPAQTFAELRHRAQAQGGLPIYLFSTSDEVFYAVTCIDIAYETTGAVIPCPDPEHTPSYYNAIKYLAWFKLGSISEHPIDQAEVVGKFAYVHVSDALTEEQEATALFDRKEIASTDELKKQNRTIWFIRKQVAALRLQTHDAATKATSGAIEPDLVNQLLSSMLQIKSQVEILATSKPGGVPESLLSEMTEAVSSATAVSNRLKADIVLPEKEQMNVKLTPVYLLEHYNEYSVDLTTVQLVLGAFLGTFLGALGTIALSTNVTFTPAVTATFVILLTVVILLGLWSVLLFRRKANLWSQITGKVTTRSHDSSSPGS